MEAMKLFEHDPKVIQIKSMAMTALLTVLRDKNTLQTRYVRYADRLCRLIAEEGLAQLCDQKIVETPCGSYNGIQIADEENICAVSVIRSGDILLNAVRELEPKIKVGKILIQRDESDPEKRPKLYYSKLPRSISSCKVFLVDPMLATGGSAIAATRVILDAGVPQENIYFLNCIACVEGVQNYHKAFPGVVLVTAAIDDKLNDEKFIVPGLGDFGDRYFGTL